MAGHHHKRPATSDKRKKDGHSDRVPSGSGSEMPRTLRKHKVKSVSSATLYEGPPENSYSAYAPQTGEPITTRRTVHWGDEQSVEQNQYGAPGQFMAENPSMAEGAYTTPGQYYIPNEWDPMNEDPVQFALDAMVSGPYAVSEDTARHAYPIRQDHHYSQPHPPSPSLHFEERRQARASAGYSSSYGKTPSSNRYADELREKRKNKR